MTKQTIILISILGVALIGGIVAIFYFNAKSKEESEAVRLAKIESDARLREEQLRAQQTGSVSQIGSQLGAGIGGIIGMFTS